MTCVDAFIIHRPAAMPALASRVMAAAEPMEIDLERPEDAGAREALLDRAFGPARFAKTCERLRAGRRPASGLSLVARPSGLGSGAADDGRRTGCALVGTLRLWHVDAGGVAALMLGPLAVDEGYRCHRLGGRLMEEAIARAEALGHHAILLVGDAAYYERFGFERRHTRDLRLPGPVEDARFLGLELTPSAFAGATGMVRATGAVDLAARRLGRKTLKLRRAA